jgi:hypothetical protein
MQGKLAQQVNRPVTVLSLIWEAVGRKYFQELAGLIDFPNFLPVSKEMHGRIDVRNVPSGIYWKFSKL